MATHSSILAWEMPRTEEPDGPHSMGPIRVGLNPATTNRSISKDHTRVCVCVCVCVSVCLCACLWFVCSLRKVAIESKLPVSTGVSILFTPTRYLAL